MENGIATTWVLSKGMSNEKEIKIEPGTFILDNRTVDWWDLMYSLIPLEPGASVTVPVLYPDELKLEPLEIKVRTATEQLYFNDVVQTALVCDVGSPAQVHYVTEQGQLLMVERPEESVTIKLTDGDYMKSLEIP